MKQLNSIILLSIVSVLPVWVSAQKIFMGNAGFVLPVVEKWVSEYKKENPLTTIRVETGNNTTDVSDIRVIAHYVQEGELHGEQTVSYLGRYALVSVTHLNNPLLQEIKSKGIAKKDLKNLIFDKTPEEEYSGYEEYEEEKEKYSATVYARDSKACTAIALAGYFGQTPAQIKGKKVFGDDIFLLNAIKKDITGVTFNSLNYVFDLQTRQLKQGIALLPLKLKSSQKEALNSQNIDAAIALLETTSVESIPVERFGFVIPAASAKNKEIVDFISWVLHEGQKYNHELGFLKLDEQTLAAQN
jgi:ABC-type phosphate transport system substrate-binding protein